MEGGYLTTSVSTVFPAQRADLNTLDRIKSSKCVCI